jgi:hypothetical protein
MDLHSFLALARNHDDNASLLPRAEGFCPALAGTVLVPRYASEEAWEADFGPVCRRPEGEPANEYEQATRRSIDEFLATNPHVTLPPPKSSA